MVRILSIVKRPEALQYILCTVLLDIARIMLRLQETYLKGERHFFCENEPFYVETWSKKCRFRPHMML